MTDRFSGFVVALEKGIRSDDAQATIDAIKQLKGVLTVKPIVQDPAQMIAEDRARHELGRKLWEVLHDPE